MTTLSGFSKMETGEQPQQRRNWLMTIVVGRNPRLTLARILVLVVIVVVVRAYVLIPIRVQGPSMLPTYQGSGVNFINRLAYLRTEPKRGDVVSIRFSGAGLKSVMLLKRVVGVPGDTVEFRDGKLVLNGEVVEEPYMVYKSDWDMPPERLGPNQYFVVGDNRSMPIEAHKFGKTDRGRIVGKVLLCKNWFASWLP